MTRVLPEEEAPPQGKDDVVLSVQGVSKKFCRSLKKSLFYGVQDIFGELLGVRESSDTLRSQEFWALKDISFELRRGEALGLVGANGAGKTTLLRIISGLIKPDHGTVDIKGRIAPLIALGAGFNPILTGRENIYANMSILGLSKQEIDDRFQDVVDFAEIGSAIDAPVQSYSSGMGARLGFACAIHVDPEILLIDEVLAVGDIRFRAKCYRRLGELREKGIAFIMVSHNPQSILQVCHSAVYLLRGQLLFTGTPEETTTKYEEDLFSLNSTVSESGVLELPEKSEEESLGLDIASVYFTDESGHPFNFMESGQEAYFVLACKARKKIDNLNVYLKITELSQGGEDILFLANELDKAPFHVNIGINKIKLFLPCLGLPPGHYAMNIKIKEGSIKTIDFVKIFKFMVKADSRMYKCKYYQPREWQVETFTN